MFNCLPDDKRITEMDSITKNWMFFSWLEDTIERNDLLKNVSCLIGSFWNPKAAEQMLNKDKNHQNISVSEEEFDKSIEYIKEYKNQPDVKKRKRKKKISFENLKE